MPSFETAIEIDRTPADVYEYATDPTKFPEWQRDVVSVRIAEGAQPGPGSLSKGSKFFTTRRIGAVKRTLAQEVTDARAPSYWVASGVDGPILATGALTVEPLNDGSRSRVTFAIDYEGRGPGKLIMPLVMRQTRAGAPKSFERLKELLESRA